MLTTSYCFFCCLFLFKLILLCTVLFVLGFLWGFFVCIVLGFFVGWWGFFVVMVLCCFGFVWFFLRFSL